MIDELLTPRLILPPFETRDAPDVARMAGNPQLSDTLYQLPRSYRIEDAPNGSLATPQGEKRRGCIPSPCALVATGLSSRPLHRRRAHLPGRGMQLGIHPILQEIERGESSGAVVIPEQPTLCERSE